MLAAAIACCSHDHSVLLCLMPHTLQVCERWPQELGKRQRRLAAVQGALGSGVCTDLDVQRLGGQAYAAQAAVNALLERRSAAEREHAGDKAFTQVWVACGGVCTHKPSNSSARQTVAHTKALPPAPFPITHTRPCCCRRCRCARRLKWRPVWPNSARSWRSSWSAWQSGGSSCRRIMHRPLLRAVQVSEGYGCMASQLGRCAHWLIGQGRSARLNAAAAHARS